MGGAVYYRDTDGNVHKVSADNPLPIADSGAVQSSTVGQPGGPAGPLDQNGEIPLAQIPIDGLNYLGAWDASTNTPTLADGSGTAGDLYRVSVAGSQDLGSGTLVFNVGDHVIYEGNVWQQLDAAQVIDWGDIQGTLSNQTDLQTALDAKADDSSLATVATSGAYSDLSGRPIIRDSGTVALHLDGEDLIWPSDIDNGKIRLWNGNPGSANRFYGFGIDQVTFIIQGDENVNYVFNKSDGTDARIELFRIANDGDVTAQGDLHMSEKHVVNIADGVNPRDAVNLQQLNAAIAGAGTQSDLGAPQSHNTVLVGLTASSPTVQLIDTSAGDTEVTLPTVASVTPGKRFFIKRITDGGNGLTIMRAETGGQTGLIDGVGSIGMGAQYSVREVVFDGTGWSIISSFGS